MFAKALQLSKVGVYLKLPSRILCNQLQFGAEPSGHFAAWIDGLTSERGSMKLIARKVTRFSLRFLFLLVCVLAVAWQYAILPRFKEVSAIRHFKGLGAEINY